MSLLGTNIKYLRNKNNLSQAELAEKLAVPRSSLSDYERGHTHPSIDCLVRMCDIFDLSLDNLVRTNVSHIELEIIRNEDFRVLAISVDSENNSNIELVETKAEAGYLQQFHDPEYIKDLPKISFPNIPQGTFRGFEIRGDSMLPMASGSVIICSYVEKLADIKNDKTYVVISKDEGVVYKRVKLDSKGQKIILMSDNDLYLPYALSFSDIAEVWEYYAHLSFSDQKLAFENRMEEKINDIQIKISEIYNGMLNK